jgi:hypothetical protein
MSSVFSGGVAFEYFEEDKNIKDGDPGDYGISPFLPSFFLIIDAFANQFQALLQWWEPQSALS